MGDFLTWKEFKAEVDRQLKELGIDENIRIGYIDTGGSYIEGGLLSTQIIIDPDDNKVIGIT